jgi:3-oxoacyl-[acyl-carrier-protein] synthase-3
MSQAPSPALPASPFAAKITGTGSSFPENRVTNAELARRGLDTSDEWIRERTGIVERRLARPGVEAERNSSLACRAAQRALEMAGKTPQDLDQILYATCTPDTLIPSSACWLQTKLGARRASALDVNAACSGFVYGLGVAEQYLKAGAARTSLVVGADILSAFTNWEDRGSCILFGDAAGAAVLERTSPEDPQRILSTHVGSDGDLWELFQMPAGGSNQEVTPEVHAARLDKMQMKGKEIFKIAVKTLADYAVLAVESNGLKLSDVDWLVPHQANLRIIEAVAKRLGVPMSKVILNIERYGNTSSATVPTAFDEAVRDGRIQRGQLVLFDVFGAGLTFASALLRW